MALPTLTILYVDDPTASAAFYEDLLGLAPVESSPTFAIFVHAQGKLGLWSRHSVQPAPAAPAGAGELAFALAAVDAVHAEWAGRGVRIVQPPLDAEFGRNFLALDPDGHRLRVYDPA